MTDLADGCRLRCLTVVDDCTRGCLALEVDTSITGTRVRAVMQRPAETRGLPRSVTVGDEERATPRCIATKGELSCARENWLAVHENMAQSSAQIHRSIAFGRELFICVF